MAEETGQHHAPPEDVFVHIFAGVVKPTASRAWINGVLFVATIWSTLLVGATNVVEPQAWTDVISPSYLLNGLPFSATLLVILLAHEFGHSFAARFHRVAVTLPYFIPMPFSIIGTMGAFIQLKAPVKNKRALFDVGAAGPLAGMAFALPILLYGLSTSPVGPMPSVPYMLEGNSILYAAAKILMLGQVLPANGLEDTRQLCRRGCEKGVIRSAGAGAQHVNPTDSAVRITHQPSGIVVASQVDRSQHKNREIAMGMLKARMYEAEMRKREEAASAEHAAKTDIGLSLIHISEPTSPY